MIVEERASPARGGALRAGGVACRRLDLTDFRSYASASLEFCAPLTAFVGENGAGKTNILEALSLFGPGRGLRGAALADLPRKDGSGGWAAAAAFDADGEEPRRLGVGATADAPNRRKCRLDGGPAKGPSAFAAIVRFLWLTPAQDRLFMDAAGERRRFLDRMTQASDPTHADVAGDYENAMRQRQRLLDDGVEDDVWLTALEARMAAAGVAVAAARRETAARLQAADIAGDAARIAGAARFPAADIELEGALEAALAEAPAAMVEDDFLSELRGARARDAAAGRALVGPHRSDLLVTHREKATPARLCSTGEQKALLVGLVLAHALQISRLDAGAPVLLLLDEIAAHLDAARRTALFAMLEATGFHCFMTGTDQSLFDGLGGRAQGFEIANGAAREIALP